MKERFHIFTLPIATIPAGETVQGIVGRLDFDGPYVVRSWSAFRANGGVALGDDKVLVRVQGPSGAYLHTDFTPLSRVAPGSTSSQWTPVYPELVYPAGGAVIVDVQNSLGVPLTGLVLMARGVKLFPDSMEIPGASAYPERFASTPFDLPRWHSLAVTGQLSSVALNAPPDAAVVIRSISIQNSSRTTATPAAFTNLFIRLRDANYKAYSNDWVRYQYLCDSDPSEPRAIFPQIYLPPSGVMYYDLLRADAPGAAADFCMTFKGSKVFAR
jgi:hypothetical protein